MTSSPGSGQAKAMATQVKISLKGALLPGPERCMANWCRLFTGET